LTLTFSAEIVGLSADDISITGAADVSVNKGALTKTVTTDDGVEYVLAISRGSWSNDTQVSVTVAKSGYNVFYEEQEITYATLSTGPEIVLSVIADIVNSKVKIAKYFANDYSVDWGDATTTDSVPESGVIHSYAKKGEYTITLTPKTDTAEKQRWIFKNGAGTALVPASSTTVGIVRVSQMPAMRFFMTSDDTAGNHFFSDFNSSGAISSFPVGSFDTSAIKVVGSNFFSNFSSNEYVYYTEPYRLPAGSFNIGNIETVGDYFFFAFNGSGGLKELPAGSFNIGNIETVGDYFFAKFNENGKLNTLPDNSFRTDNIKTVGGYFFAEFNRGGELSAFPDSSFETGFIKTVGEYFFFSFIRNAKNLSSLPQYSFKTSSIETVGNNFFSYFNAGGSLTTLPVGSFDIGKIKNTQYSFFEGFNYQGKLTSLPEGSFDTSKIEYFDMNCFKLFNYEGALPDNIVPKVPE
jgi:hypothetical protein